MNRVIALLLCMITTSAWCDEGETGPDVPLNRIDFTSVYFDTIDTDSLTGLFGYTRSISPQSKLGIRMTYLDSRFGESGGGGQGDTVITYSWLPTEQMSVAPWLPRLVGSGLSLTLPTGNENEGRGLGSTIVTPFIGTLVSLTDTLSLTPTLAYGQSIDPIVTGDKLRVGLLDLGLTWTGQNGWWVSLFVGYLKDFESSSTTTGGRVSAGKVFDSGWGFSAHFIDMESFQPGRLPPVDNHFNQVYEFTLMYGF